MGNGNRAEMVIAVCAVITSVVALFIGWDQARIMRLQQKADVWPMIQVTHQTAYSDHEVIYALQFENAGVGPALIDSHYIYIPGKEDPSSFLDLVEYASPDSFGPPQLGTSSFDGRVIRQGSELVPIRASWVATPKTTAALQSRVGQFVNGELEPAVVFACYCSILEECWVSSTLEEQTRPAKVKSCTTLRRDAHNLIATYGK